jgi:hypothetical protein
MLLDTPLTITDSETGSRQKAHNKKTKKWALLLEQLRPNISSNFLTITKINILRNVQQKSNWSFYFWQLKNDLKPCYNDLTSKRRIKKKKKRPFISSTLNKKKKITIKKDLILTLYSRLQNHNLFVLQKTPSHRTPAKQSEDKNAVLCWGQG